MSIIALREESGVEVRDVEVLAEENVVSKTGISFLLLLMSFINYKTLTRKSNFSSSGILLTAGITEMENALSSSGAVLLLLKAFKISLSISCCSRDFIREIYVSLDVFCDCTSTSVPACFSSSLSIKPYPTAFPYGNGMVLHFYQQQESSTTKTVHKVINKGLKAYV